jgi:hypothetical protein
MKNDPLTALILVFFGVWQLWIAYRIKTTRENVILFHEKIALDLYEKNKAKQDEIRAGIKTPRSAHVRMYFSLIFGVLFLFLGTVAYLF